MLVNGKSADAMSLDALLEEVMNLPSGFESRTARRTDDSVYLSSNAYKLSNEADTLVVEWERTKSPKTLQQAYELHESAIESANQTNNPLIKAITLSRCCDIAAFVSKDIGIAIRYMLDASLLAEEAGAMDFASQYAGKVHDYVYKKVKFGFENSIPAEQLQPWVNILRDMRRRAGKLFKNQYGEPVDADAYRIEQGEVGFSYKERIGTDFLVQCVSPILKNPTNGKIAFSHIDHGTDINSLNAVLGILGYSDHGAPIMVRLVGGNPDSEKGSDLQKKFFSSVARNNIYALFTFFKDKNVNIVSSDILNEGQPTSVVVDPEKFDLYERIPGKYNPDYYLANARAMFSAPGKSLHVAFDLERSKLRNPIFVDSQLAETAGFWADQSIIEIYDALIGNSKEAGGLVADRVESADQLGGCHRNTVNSLLKEFSLNVQAAQMSGARFSTDDIQKVIDIVTTRPVYLGENAGVANSALKGFMRHHAIKQNKLTKSYAIDFEGIGRNDFYYNSTNHKNVFPRLEL